MGIVADGCSPYIISRCRIADSDRRRSVADTVIPYRNGRTATGFGRIAHSYPIIGRNGRYTGILIVCHSRFRIVADSHTVFGIAFGAYAFRDTVVPYRFCLVSDRNALFTRRNGFQTYRNRLLILRFRLISKRYPVFSLDYGTGANRHTADRIGPCFCLMSHSDGIVCQCLYFIPECQRINTVRFCLCTLGNRMRLLCFCVCSYGNTILSRSGRARPPDYPACRIRISRKHTAGNHHGAQKRAKRTDFRHRGFIISADPLRNFRNDYVAILHPAPYDLVYLIHNFNPILSLLQKCFLRCTKR